jgi:hypothetical protein
MSRRFVLSVLLAAFAAPAAAANYWDLWYNPDESGWGVQVVQSNTYQFLTFFVYGADGKPTWFVASLNEGATGTYTGPLFATTGTYYALPWDPAKRTTSEVGTVTFQSIDAYHAQVTYGLTGSPPVTKTVQRQSLTAHVLAGDYSGSLTGSVTGCTDPANNKSTVRGRYNLAVSQGGDTSASLTFTFVDGMVCTLSGQMSHFGALYRMANAQYGCTGQGITPGVTSATVERFHATQQGIEGRWTATAGGCTESIRFAAVEN